MATQIQLRRGTATQNNAFTGAVGEVTADTTNNKLRLHDGSTAGGHAIGGGTFADIAGGGTFTGNVTLEDSTFLIFGNSTDFYIEHNGGVSRNLVGSQQDMQVNLSTGKELAVRVNNNERFMVDYSGVHVPDNTEYYIGSGDDAYLNHDGSNTNFVNNNGELKFIQQGNGGLWINTSASTNSSIYLESLGSLKAKAGQNSFDLYYSGSKKFETTTTGVTVTGGIIAGGLTYPTSDGSSGQFLKTDGSGNLTFADAGGGLDYFTEGISTSSPHSASSGAVKLEASGTPARLDVYLHPKDDGALCNGSESDGNKRGVFAVDLQATRDNADEVASGGRSAILGGSGNKATVNWSTAVGGQSNTASGVYSFVGGGNNNTASSSYSFVGGGDANEAKTNSYAAVVGGKSNDATGTYSFVGGGQTNEASGDRSTVGGGINNDATNDMAVIAGGNGNDATGATSAICGGSYNDATGTSSFVGGGASNTASSSYSFVGGGKDNTATNEYATIGGGDDNNASGSKSTVAGGRENEATGAESAVSGGYYNFAEGNQSFAGGGIGNKASSTGSVVCGGNTNEAKSMSYTAVVGGQNNDATGDLSFLGGGYGNTSSGSGAVVGGGQTNLASSQFSTVAGGNNNTANGTRSIVLGGAYNQANAGYTTVVGGKRGYARGTIGKIVFPACNSPVSNTAGAQQAALLVVGASTTDATTTTLRSDVASASATNQCALRNGGCLYAFTITVVGRETSTGHYASIKFEGVIDKQDSSSNVTIRTTPTKTVLATNGDGSNWDAAVDADTTNQALRVKVTGEASTTIKWVARIDTIELGL